MQVHQKKLLASGRHGIRAILAFCGQLKNIYGRCKLKPPRFRYLFQTEFPVSKIVSRCKVSAKNTQCLVCNRGDKQLAFKPGWFQLIP